MRILYGALLEDLKFRSQVRDAGILVKRRLLTFSRLFQAADRQLLLDFRSWTCLNFHVVPMQIHGIAIQHKGTDAGALIRPPPFC